MVNYIMGLMIWNLSKAFDDINLDNDETYKFGVSLCSVGAQIQLLQ